VLPQMQDILRERVEARYPGQFLEEESRQGSGPPSAVGEYQDFSGDEDQNSASDEGQEPDTATITLSSSNDITNLYLEDLRIKVIRALPGLAIFDCQGRQEQPVTSDEATVIADWFFNNMMDNVTTRIRAIVKQAPMYNARNKDEAVPGDIPECLRSLYTCLRAVVQTGGLNNPAMINKVQRNIQLALFREDWDRIKTSIREEGSEYNEIIKCVKQPTGTTTWIAKTKSYICEKVGIGLATFDHLQWSGNVPSSLVKAFGSGSILFMPTPGTL